MISIGTSYVGRQVDLSLLPDIAQPSTPVDMKLSTNSKAISGPMSAAQNFVRLLLTPSGAYKSDPDIGCDFHAKLSGRNLRYSSDLLHLFLIESNKILDYMTRNGETLPSDERITAADLIGSGITGTTVEMTIQFTTAAGTNLTILLPVQWSI